MPIHPDSIKTPVRLVPRTYVPANGHSYPVQVGDSWVSLAPAGMTPWDLIRYNFPYLPADNRLAAKEVNWYLENHLGCTLLTHDNRNYRFSPPATIWIPNAPPTLDQQAKNLVLSTLRSPYIARMTFGVGYRFIHAHYYEEVAKAIDSGKINVKAITGHIALYHHSITPALIEVNPALGDLGLLVHECTHAIFDMRKYESYVGESEGFGYLSQALYNHFRRGGAPRNRHLVSRDPSNPISQAAWQLIFDESARLADLLARTPWVSQEEAQILFNAIGNANIYVDRVGKLETFDGI